MVVLVVLGSDALPPSSTALPSSLGGGTTWRGVTPGGMMSEVTRMAAAGMTGMTMSKALNPGAGLLGEYNALVVLVWQISHKVFSLL